MKIFEILLGIAASLSVISNVIFNFFGFYLTGDTVSYIYYSLFYSVGGPIEVFIKHTELWPPLISILFGFLRELPISILSQERVYVLFTLLFIILVTYLLSVKVTEKILYRIVIVALSLFSSIQVLILRSAIPEALFILLWISSIYWLITFVTTKNQLTLFLFIIHASLIPLSRYLGIGVLFGFLLSSLFLYPFFKKEKYSIYILTSATFLIMSPIIFYLLKNKLLTDIYLRSGDPQLTKENLMFFFLQNNYSFLKDMSIPGIFALLFGFNITWDRTKHILLKIALTTLIGYQILLTISSQKFRIIENFPSRFISPTYPVIVFILILVGSYVAFKIPKIRKVAFITIPALTIFLFLLAYQTILNTKMQIQSNYNYVEEPKYSGVVNKLCKLYPDKKRFIFMQPASRNWVAHALRYYCMPIEDIPVKEDFYIVQKKSVIYSPYILRYDTLEDVTFDQSPHIPLIYNTGGRKDIKIYLVKEDTKINVSDEIKKLGPLD